MTSSTPKIVYKDEPMGEVEVVADFLPSPAELAFKASDMKAEYDLSKLKARKNPYASKLKKPVTMQMYVSLLSSKTAKMLPCNCSSAPLKKPVSAKFTLSQ
jgi:hypothetical protein